MKPEDLPYAIKAYPRKKIWEAVASQIIFPALMLFRCFILGFVSLSIYKAETV